MLSDEGEDDLKLIFLCLKVVTRKDRNMTIPTIMRINPFFFSFRSSCLLISKYTTPAITIRDMTPIRIKDTDIYLLFIYLKSL